MRVYYGVREEKTKRRRMRHWHYKERKDRRGMEKRLKDYLQFMEDLKIEEFSEEESKAMANKMLVQIQFFQHERLIHLIVTVTFAILTVLSIFAFLALEQIGLLALSILLLVLLVPYIRHYYILENGVQKLYTYYDKLVK